MDRHGVCKRTIVCNRGRCGFSMEKSSQEKFEQ